MPMTIGVIMAGGYGTRMAELNTVCPKPLQVVGGKPLVQRAIEWLEAHFKLSHLVVVAFHRAERVADVVRGLHNPLVRCVVEERKLGTAGYVVKLAHSSPVESRFVVVNADVVTNWTPPGLDGNWVAAVTRDVDVPYGSLEVDENSGALISVREKWATYEAAAGIYFLVGRSIRAAVPTSIPIEMPDLLTAIASQGGYAPVHVVRMPPGTYWRDIATPACLAKAQADADAGRV